MEEGFSLKEFLDPSIIEWMNTNLQLDSEHAATVTSNSRVTELLNTPQLETSDVTPLAIGVIAISEMKQGRSHSTEEPFPVFQMPQIRQNSKGLAVVIYNI